MKYVYNPTSNTILAGLKLRFASKGFDVVPEDSIERLRLMAPKLVFEGDETFPQIFVRRLTPKFSDTHPIHWIDSRRNK